MQNFSQIRPLVIWQTQTKTETKAGFRPITTYYKWNSQSQLVELVSPYKGTWRYEYDGFGRRISKYQLPSDDQPLPNQLINMPIRPNQDYWHKITELWNEQEKNFAKIDRLHRHALPLPP